YERSPKLQALTCCIHAREAQPRVRPRWPASVGPGRLGGPQPFWYSELRAAVSIRKPEAGGWMQRLTGIMLAVAVGAATLSGCALRDPRDDYAYGRADGLWDTSYDLIDWNFPTSANQG